MKKTLSLFTLLLAVATGFTQTDAGASKHLTFKGVPLDGTLSSYVLKMKQNGFTHLSTENGLAMLKGDFAGYKDCYVGVSTLKQQDLVHKIVVIFPEKETWSTLSGNYFDLKQLLTEKYGEPTNEVEKFDSYSEPNDDSDRMHETKMDRCKYYSIWETDKGEIQLSIEHESVVSCFVKLAYFDAINGATVKKQALDDL